MVSIQESYRSAVIYMLLKLMAADGHRDRAGNYPRCPAARPRRDGVAGARVARRRDGAGLAIRDAISLSPAV